MKLSEIIKDPQAVIVCHCERDARFLCSKLHMAGLKWASGELYTEDVKFHTSDIMSVFCFNPCLGVSGTYNYFKNTGCSMMLFSEVEFDCIDFGYLKGSDPLTKKVSSQPQHTETPIIDWEQRRYEIAKDVLGVLAARDGMASEYELNIERAVAYADKLIEHLK